MYLSIAEYDTWACQKQGLSSVNHPRFLHTVTQVMFGHGVCTLSASEIERKAGLTPSTRRRVMKQLEAAGLIEVETNTKSFVTHHTIRRVPITESDLIEFGKSKWSKGLDNSLQIRLHTRRAGGKKTVSKKQLLPGFHESFFEPGVGDKLVIDGSSPDELQFRFVEIADCDCPEEKVFENENNKTTEAPELADTPAAKSGASNRNNSGTKTGAHNSKQTNTNKPTARALRKPSLRSGYAPRVPAEPPASGSEFSVSEFASVAFGSEAQGPDPAGSGPSAMDRLVDTVLEVVETKIDQKFKELKSELGFDQTRPKPKTSKPKPQKTASKPKSSNDTIAHLQGFAMSLAIPREIEDEIKPISDKSAPKILKAVKKLGGIKEAEEYLRYVFDKELDWFANFCWKDRDVYALLCNGAIKEWRLESGRVKASELKTEKQYRTRGRKTGIDRLRESEWDGRKKGVGEW